MQKFKNPHDRFFKSAMSSKHVAREFLEMHLPTKMLNAIDLNHLKIQKESYLSEHLKLSLADLVIETTFKSANNHVLILIEHQSTPEKDMPFRIHKYVMAIMDDYAKRNPRSALPVVFPMIFYTGTREYNYSTNIVDLIANPYNLPTIFSDSPIKVIELNKIKDEELIKKTHYGIMALIMKRIKMQPVEDLLYKVKNLIRTMAKLDEQSYINSILRYMFVAGEIRDQSEVRKIVEEILTQDETEGKVMATLAQYFREEGREQGIERGRQEGRQEGLQIGIQEGKVVGFKEGIQQVARNMIANKVPVKLISEMTKLSEEEINALEVES